MAKEELFKHFEDGTVGDLMKCRDCRYLSKRKTFYPQCSVVRCTLGVWDKNGIRQWYSFGNTMLNRAAVRRYGATCQRGELR